MSLNQWLIGTHTAWEENAMTPQGDFNHMIALTPDWPPPSSFDIALSQLRRKHKRNRARCLEAEHNLRVAYGKIN